MKKMNIFGSEYILTLLHALSQSLLIPVVVGLLLMSLYVVVQLGNLLAEKHNRKNKKDVSLLEMIIPEEKNQLRQSTNLYHAVENAMLSNRQRNIIFDFLSKGEWSQQ